MSIVPMVKSNASDARIADAVIKNVPKGTYLTIQVYTGSYDFPGLGKKNVELLF